MRIAALAVLLACGQSSMDATAPDARARVDAYEDDAMVDARDLAANRVFVSRPTSLAFGSLANADTFCMAQAADRGFSGAFVAWLSTTATPARSRLVGSRGWMRDDGMPVVDTIDDLIAGKILYPIFARPDGASTEVATGTRPDGTVAEDSCDDFTSEARGLLAARGGTYAGTEQWTSYGWVNCERASIYCFEVGKVAPVEPPAVPGRVAFVTAGMYVAGGGIEAADAACNREATNANAPGTYRALLATSTTPATRRFVDGLPWIRPDGVQVTASAAAFLEDGKLQAPINVTLGGAYVAGHAWMGATYFDAVGSATCDDWTLTTGTGDVSQVETGRASTPWVFGSTCVIPQRLVCLQQ